jgi:hypothetical protein
MFIKNFKNFVAAITALATLATSMSTFITANATESYEYHFGAVQPSEEEIEEFMSGFDNTDTTSDAKVNDDKVSTQSSLPSSVDLSKTGFFPKIGNQSSYNSCVAWATTYYQFSYEVNKLKNDTSGTAYSPRWTYNFITCQQEDPHF